MRILILIGLLALTGACGQKGDLYLPEEGAPIPGSAATQPCRSKTCKAQEAQKTREATAPSPAAATPAEPAISLEPQSQEPSQENP